MPDAATVMKWRNRHEVFNKQYARAKEQQMELMAEQLLEIADDGLNDTVDRDGRTVVDQEHINRSRLRVDTRKWLMSKLAPKKFGDKIQQELTGPGGSTPVLTIQLAPHAADSGNQPQIAPKAITGVIEPSE